MTKKLSHWGLILPWVIFALMLAGWTAYWFVLSGETLRTLEKAKAGMPDGTRLSYSTVSIQGYPSRLLAVMTDARLDGPNNRYVLATPQASLAVSVLNPGHVLVFAQNPLRLKAAAVDWTVTADGIESSFRIAKAGGLLEARLVVSNLKVDDPAGAPSTADRFAVALKPDPKTPHEWLIAVDADGFRPGATKGLEGFANAPARFRAGLVFERADLIQPRGDPLAAWAQAGARLRIEAFEGGIGDVSATAEGAFTLDAQKRWEGALTLDFADAAAGLRAVVGSSLIEPRARGAAQAFALAQGVAGGGVNATIRAEDGRWRLGPIDLGAIDPLYPAITAPTGP
jgi:hypothetical protein